SGPVQHDVGRRNIDDPMGVRIDGVFARIQRLYPDAFFALTHQIAVLERLASDVFALLADEGDDHTDVRDRHFRHVDYFDGREAQVDEIPARQQHLFLQALA